MGLGGSTPTLSPVKKKKKNRGKGENGAERRKKRREREGGKDLKKREVDAKVGGLQFIVS